MNEVEKLKIINDELELENEILKENVLSLKNSNNELIKAKQELISIKCSRTYKFSLKLRNLLRK